MPHAVVVGTDATALHVGGQLAARGFQVTLLEASQAIGGQWVQRLVADKADGCDFNATEDGVFVDFPLTSSRTNQVDKRGANFSDLVNDESFGGPSASGRTAWAEQTKPNPALQATRDQLLLRHLADYAQAAGLHRNVRLGCTLRRAKWQAMNGCWRLELKTESVVQRGGAQLSADLLVVSRLAVAAAKMPHLPGGELYCGTVLNANDQLSGPGGSALLDQQLRGRNVLVVGPAGALSREWAELCRRHAGFGGSVVLLEVDDDDKGGAAGALDWGKQQDGEAVSPFSRLFGACLGVGSGGAGSRQRSQDATRLERFSPAQAPGDSAGGGSPSGGLLSPERGSGTSGTLEDGEVEPDGEGDLGPADMDPEARLAAVGKLDDSPTGLGLKGGTKGDGGGGDSGGGEEGGKQQTEEQQVEAGGDAPKALAGEGGSDAGGGGRRRSCGKLGAGRSSLRMLRGVGALLNGTHVMLTTGEEFPAEVVLLIPMGGLETNLSFLDAGAPARLSQAGGSSAGGSFKRAGTSMGGPFASMASMQGEALSRQMDNLYRDMLSNSPYAPNFAIVGMSPRAWEHDARTAAVQAAWLLASWSGLDDLASAPPDGTPGRGGGGGAAANGSDPGWLSGAHAGGFLRQASQVEATSDVALRARWQREAAKRGRPDLYLQRYIQQLLADLGTPLQAPSKWRCGLGSSAPPTAEQLTRQRVAKLLGLKRLRRARPSGEDSLVHAQSPRSSPSRARGTSYNGGTTFAGAHGALVLSAAAGGGVDRGSGPASREASRSSHHGGGPGGQGSIRHSTSSAQALLQRAAGSRVGGFLDAPTRSEGSYHYHALMFASQGGGSVSVGQGLSSLPSQQQQQVQLQSESCLAGGSPGILPHLNHRHSFNNGGSIGSIGNNSLSFAMAITNAQLLLSHELALYRVAEHPAEHLGDASVGGGGGDGGGGGVLKPQDHPVSQLQQHIMPSCPSSPSLALAAAMNTTGGLSTSGSIGSIRGRSAANASFSAAGGGATSFASPAAAAVAGAAAGVLASSAITSPCVLGGYGSMETGPAAVQLGPSSMGPSVDESPPQPGAPQLRQLQRHRSTSRLAGVSTAASLPSGLQPQAAASGTLALFFGRRAPAVSTSQVSFDIPQSFLTDRRSQSGRPSRNSSVRRGNHVSAGGGGIGIGGAGSCSNGSNGLLSRANSAVRLQLLLAAASSASRRRTAMTPASPSASVASCDAQRYSLTLSGPHANASAVAAAAAAASADVRLLQLRNAYGDPLQQRYGPPGSLHAPGATTGGLGTSVSVLARSMRVSNNNAHGSVSEPVAGDLASPTGTSPPRLKVYGKLGETRSAQVSQEVAVSGAPAVSGSGSTQSMTGEQQWGNSNVSLPPAVVGEDGGEVDGEEGLDGSTGTRRETPRGRRRARRRSITLPDLRVAGSGGPLQQFQDHFLPEEDVYLGGEGVVHGGDGDDDGGVF